MANEIKPKASPLFPDKIFVQVDDIDGKHIYYAASKTNEELPFTPGPNHPVRIYKLID
jgi:hypothetical protein